MTITIQILSHHDVSVCNPSEYIRDANYLLEQVEIHSYIVINH